MTIPGLATSPCPSPTQHAKAARGLRFAPSQTKCFTGQRDTIILCDEIMWNMKYALGVDESPGSGSTNTSPSPPPSSRPGAGLASRAALALQQLPAPLPAKPPPPFVAEDCRRAQPLPCTALQLQPRCGCSAMTKFATITNQTDPAFRQAWGLLEVLTQVSAARSQT